MSLKESDARLPSAYQEVEYIASSGTQYIDSNYIPTANTKTQVTCTFTKKGSNYMGITGYETNGRNTFGINNNGYSYFGVANLNNFDGNSVDVMSQKLTWEIDNPNKTYTNSIYSGSWSATYTNSQSLHFYFFVRCDIENGAMIPQNTEIGYGWLQLYEAKFYESNVLTAHYIPCYRKLDNEVGLYDLVNGEFYTNEGSGEFTCGVPIIYDSRYQQVEYIESSGTQYIILNTPFSTNSNFELDYSFATTENYVLGCSSNLFMYVIGYGYVGRNTTWETKTFTDSLDRRRLRNNVNNWYLNDSLLATSSTVSVTRTAENGMCIFAYANDAEVVSGTGSSVKLYELKQYESGVLAEHLIPCYRKSDNEIGLLDIVNDVFYTNDGGGTFTKGGNL